MKKYDDILDFTTIIDAAISKTLQENTSNYKSENNASLISNSCFWLLKSDEARIKGDFEKVSLYIKKSNIHDLYSKESSIMRQLFGMQKYNECEEIARNILSKSNEHLTSLYMLAKIAFHYEAYESTLSLLKRYFDILPLNLEGLILLADTFFEQALFDRAVEIYQRLTRLYPNNRSYLLLLAKSLSSLGRDEDCINIYDRILLKYPKDLFVLFLKGHSLRLIGLKELAIDNYKKCMIDPRFKGSGFWALADMKTYRFRKREIDEMKDYLEDEKIGRVQKCQTAFALGKSYEDKKKFEQSFYFYDLGNKLKENRNYDKNKFATFCKKAISTFEERENSNTSNDINSTIPIFIIGLPRSGSTLVEQILSSHSEVEATMELFQIPNIVRYLSLVSAQHGKDHYHFTLNSLSPSQLRELGNKYLIETSIYRKGNTYFIDKLPQNFQHIALILKILPNAKIIDLRRHPLSVGFSVYKQHFGTGHDYCYDLENIGHYYTQYLKMVNYWKNSFSSKIHTLNYESLVLNTESEIKKLLHFCDLNFESNCVDFYNNRRNVKTSSSEQVIQPIFNTEIDKYKHYLPFLSQLELSLKKYGHTIVDNLN